jgi:hypothetical protein
LLVELFLHQEFFGSLEDGDKHGDERGFSGLVYEICGFALRIRTEPVGYSAEVIGVKTGRRIPLPARN